jgi:hypothetical protein
MITPRAALVAVFAVLALAGCASMHSTNSPAATARPTAVAAHLPPGPFKITPLHCGRFTRAERNTLGTNAQGGMIYRYTNNSNTLTGAPNLSVNFTVGSAVAGNNVTADVNPIGPGQSTIGEVDAEGSSGQNLHFTGCVLMEYDIVIGSGTIPGNYGP